jgi:prephenate dehydrogenase
MDEPDFLSTAQVTIIGLGLMGGSLAMALRGHCARIWAYDPDEFSLRMAQQQGIVDRASANLEEILQDSDLIILAAPVQAILRLLGELPELVPGTPVIMDIGSTKRQIMAAMQKLPQQFDPIGGHPMCGKEKLGLVNADAGLFQGAPFAFTRLKRTSTRAQQLASQLAEAIGAKALWVDADTHDRWTAATSHLPYLLSSVLVLTTPSDARQLSGPGFRSMTRLAATPSSMMLDVLETNRDYILNALERFREQIELVETLLKHSDRNQLELLLSDSAAHKKEMG